MSVFYRVSKHYLKLCYSGYYQTASSGAVTSEMLLSTIFWRGIRYPFLTILPLQDGNCDTTSDRKYFTSSIEMEPIGITLHRSKRAFFFYFVSCIHNRWSSAQQTPADCFCAIP